MADGDRSDNRPVDDWEDATIPDEFPGLPEGPWVEATPPSQAPAPEKEAAPEEAAPEEAAPEEAAPEAPQKTDDVSPEKEAVQEEQAAEAKAEAPEPETPRLPFVEEQSGPLSPPPAPPLVQDMAPALDDLPSLDDLPPPSAPQERRQDKPQPASPLSLPSLSAAPAVPSLTKSAAATVKIAPAVRIVPEFRDPSAIRIGVLGGKASGKTYFLHALVSRLQAAGQAGALAGFLRGGRVELQRSDSPQQRPEAVRLQRFIQPYRSWTRLAFTQRDQHAWYRLNLSYRRGFLGRSRGLVKIDMWDGSGEYREMPLNPESRAEWSRIYSGASLLVFCLPLWAAFPAPSLNRTDEKEREKLLAGFDAVAQNLRSLIQGSRRVRRRTRSILLLTMADDRRGGRADLLESWIHSYLDESDDIVARLADESDLAHYLDNVRRVSQNLRRDFRATEPAIARLPEMLDFGRGRPWIVPVSSIEGAVLDASDSHDLRPSTPPVPLHVEVPLLLALADRLNALM